MSDKVFITGVGNGIGKVLAEEYAKKGFEVIGVDKEESEFIEENITFFKVDVSNEKEVAKVFEEVKKLFGEVHILINNAAISKFNKDILEIEISEFMDVINVNLKGSFLCAKEFIKANKGSGYGRIINIASTRWNQNEEGWEAYGASKGGIVSLTNTLAISLGRTNITVNAISPGWIETGDYSSLKKEDHRQHPSGRVGKPVDIFKACLYLSDKDNDFINGANIVVDGGMSKKMIYE